jgi:hypothetical protein
MGTSLHPEFLHLLNNKLAEHTNFEEIYRSTILACSKSKNSFITGHTLTHLHADKIFIGRVTSANWLRDPVQTTNITDMLKANLTLLTFGTINPNSQELKTCQSERWEHEGDEVVNEIAEKRTTQNKKLLVMKEYLSVESLLKIYVNLTVFTCACAVNAQNYYLNHTESTLPALVELFCKPIIQLLRDPLMVGYFTDFGTNKPQIFTNFVLDTQNAWSSIINVAKSIPHGERMKECSYIDGACLQQFNATVQQTCTKWRNLAYSNTTATVDHWHPMHRALHGDPNKSNDGKKRGGDGKQQGQKSSGNTQRNGNQNSNSGANNDNEGRPEKQRKKSPGLIKMKDSSKPCPRITVKAKHHTSGEMKTICKNYIVDGLHCSYTTCAYAHVNAKTRGQPAEVGRNLNAWVEQHKELLEFKNNFNPEGVFDQPTGTANNGNATPAPTPAPSN